jgi:CheY-like chemotaxis protein
MGRARRAAKANTDRTMPAKSPETDPKASEQKRIRVMVVDDDPAATGTLCRLLAHKGYAVHEVNDSRLALETALEFQPHVVILDFLMPNLHGGDVAWQLSSNPNLRDARLIVSSAYSPTEIRRNLPPAMIPILGKPVDANELLRLITEEGSEP